MSIVLSTISCCQNNEVSETIYINNGSSLPLTYPNVDVTIFRSEKRVWCNYYSSLTTSQYQSCIIIEVNNIIDHAWYRHPTLQSSLNNQQGNPKYSPWVWRLMNTKDVANYVVLNWTSMMTMMFLVYYHAATCSVCKGEFMCQYKV